MKLKCGRTQAERDARELAAQARFERLNKWHSYYPWWPRRVAPGDCRCFEWIERRLLWTQVNDYTWMNVWDYRA